MSDAVRSRRSDTRYEPQFGSPPAGPAGQKDPLAELARVVGQDDPFRGMFQDQGTAAPRAAGLRGSGTPSNDDGSRSAYRDGADQPRFRPSTHEADAGADPSAGYDERGYDEHGHFGEHDEVYDEAHHGRYDPRSGAAADYASAAEPEGAVHHEPDPDHRDAHDREGAEALLEHPLTPDLWAEGAHEPSGRTDMQADESAGPTRAPRRPLVVLAAVLLLTGGGLAATFLARTGPATGSGKATPTILAANGPNKVKLEDPAATAPEDADAALLNKNGGKASGPAKVVTSQEQPIDLAQLPKAAPREDGGASSGSAPVSSSPFPEPKRVKTFLVRPDGSMVTSGAPASTANAAQPSAQPPASNQIASLPIGLLPTDVPPPATARPATPKTTARAPTTPKVASTPPGDVAPSPATTGKAKQPASPGVHATTKPKPIENADTSPTASTGGAFGLQLAAAPSEQEARDIFSKLQKRYSDQLGALRPSVRKAESGDKSVYRLRVGSLSQDEAKSLCTKLQASGGTCFVVHN